MPEVNIFGEQHLGTSNKRGDQYSRKIGKQAKGAFIIAWEIIVGSSCTLSFKRNAAWKVVFLFGKSVDR